MSHESPDNHEIETLVEAMGQLLDDMQGGQSVSLWAKAQARIAYEPFRDKSEPELKNWMTLEEAWQIIRFAQAG